MVRSITGTVAKVANASIRNTVFSPRGGSEVNCEFNHFAGENCYRDRSRIHLSLLS